MDPVDARVLHCTLFTRVYTIWITDTYCIFIYLRTLWPERDLASWYTFAVCKTCARWLADRWLCSQQTMSSNLKSMQPSQNIWIIAWLDRHLATSCNNYREPWPCTVSFLFCVGWALIKLVLFSFWRCRAPGRDMLGLGDGCGWLDWSLWFFAREDCKTDCKLDASDAAFALSGVCKVCDHSICFHCEDCP